MAIRWTTAFWDFPALAFEAGTEFWLDVTRSTLSEFRGPDRDFATLVPPGGADAYLRVQRVRSGAGGNHLDLHVDDVAAEAERARSLGADVVFEEDGLVVFRSPGGLPFCVVSSHGEGAAPLPVHSAGGQYSLVDQFCIDIPPATYEREATFWQRFTGRERKPSRRPEYERLDDAPGWPLRLLLQRLDTADPGQPVKAHIDLGCTDIDAETERHIALGATPTLRTEGWQTLRDTAGLDYCITKNDPGMSKISGSTWRSVRGDLRRLDSGRT